MCDERWPTALPNPCQTRPPRCHEGNLLGGCCSPRTDTTMRGRRRVTEWLLDNTIRRRNRVSGIARRLLDARNFSRSTLGARRGCGACRRRRASPDTTRWPRRSSTGSPRTGCRFPQEPSRTCYSAGAAALVGAETHARSRRAGRRLRGVRSCGSTVNATAGESSSSTAEAARMSSPSARAASRR